jgi:hypothetical protein
MVMMALAAAATAAHGPDLRLMLLDCLRSELTCWFDF